MEVQQFPPRFEVSGVLVNVYQRPEGKTKDGEVFGGEWCTQLMSADHLRNGESKLVSTDLIVGKEKADAEKHRPFLGKVVRLPATVYVNRQNQLVVSLANSKGVANGTK